MIDKNWQKIMARARDNPNAVACCVGDELLNQLLPHLQEQLELCQKSLSGSVLLFVTLTSLGITGTFLCCIFLQNIQNKIRKIK